MASGAGKRGGKCKERERLRHEGDDDMKQKVRGQNQSENVTQLKEHCGDVLTHLLQIFPLHTRVLFL